jgi:hypothetical protein
MTMSMNPRRSILGCLAAAGLIALAAQPGCQDSTAPPPPDVPPVVEVVFTPAADMVEAIRGQALLLSARAVGADSFRTVFTRGDDTLSTDPDLSYVPAAVGEDTLTATVTYGGGSEQHRWRLQVSGPGLDPPPQPRDFQVIITDQVYVTWTGEPGYDGPVPLRRYELRARPRGVVDAAHWDVAFPVAEVEFSPDRPDYIVVLTVAAPILPIGTPVGFGLRLRDTDDVLSPLARDDVFIPPGIIVEGTVTSLDGQPMPDVEVRWSYCDGRTRTDAAGRYRSYLLPRHAVVGIRYSDDGIDTPGTGAYYDAEITWQAESEQVQDIMLLPVSTIDPTCGSERYAGDFLNYLRDMTYTDPSIYPRQHYVTSRWRHLPITYRSIACWNDDGTFSLDALADSAVAVWNQRLGEDYFVPAADPDSAQLTIYFANEGLGTNIAITRITDPAQMDINTAIPRRMTIQGRTDFPASTFAFEVLLHEVGHSLCLSGHSRCNTGIHVMEGNPQGIVARRWPESPIHDDEVHLVHMIYTLSPDQPLDIYRVD